MTTRTPAQSGAISADTIGIQMAVQAPPAPVSAPIAMPPPPRTAEETGLPFSFVCDLVLKVLYFNGTMLGRDIADHLCLPFVFIETTLRFLADEGYAA